MLILKHFYMHKLKRVVAITVSLISTLALVMGAAAAAPAKKVETVKKVQTIKKVQTVKKAVVPKPAAKKAVKKTVKKTVKKVIKKAAVKKVETAKKKNGDAEKKSEAPTYPTVDQKVEDTATAGYTY